MEKIFWLEEWDGEARGGLYVRNPLKEIVERMEKENKNLVGIKYDGSYNLELIFEEM